MLQNEVQCFLFPKNLIQISPKNGDDVMALLVR